MKKAEFKLIPRVALGPRVVLCDNGDWSATTWQKKAEFKLIPRVALGPPVVLCDNGDWSATTWQKGGVQKRCAESDNTPPPGLQEKPNKAEFKLIPQVALGPPVVLCDNGDWSATTWQKGGVQKRCAESDNTPPPGLQEKPNKAEFKLIPQVALGPPVVLCDNGDWSATTWQKGGVQKRCAESDNTPPPGFQEKPNKAEFKLIPRVALGPPVVLCDNGDWSATTWQKGGVQKRCAESDNTPPPGLQEKPNKAEFKLIPQVALGPPVVLCDNGDWSATTWQKGGVQKRCAESDNTPPPGLQEKPNVSACSQHLFDVLEDLTLRELDKFRSYVIEGTLEGFSSIPADLLPNGSCDIAERLMEVYGMEGSLIVTAHALKTIHRDDLASRISPEVEGLQTAPKESTDDGNLDWMMGDVAQCTCCSLSYVFGTDSCKLLFDYHTAHPNLCLSEGDTEATFLSKKQPHPGHPERFDMWPQVLCREGLRDGRFCWEMRWDGYAAIGIAYKSITRKGKGDECGLGFNEKSWALLCETKQYSAWHNGSPTPLSKQPESSRRIRVCLDWCAGTLTFYKVAQDTLIHLHTFNAKFSAPVYPMVRFYYFSQFGSSVALSPG